MRLLPQADITNQTSDLPSRSQLMKEYEFTGFPTLRTLLSQPPSQDTFAEIVQLFRAWHEENQRQQDEPNPQNLGHNEALAYNYALSHLAGWPDQLRQISIHDCWPHYASTSPLPHLELTRVLTFEGPGSLQEANMLLQGVATSPYAAQLRDLTFTRELSKESIHAITHSSSLSQLTHLRLPHSKLHDEGAQAIADSPYLTQLKLLDLNGNKLKAAGLGALARSPNTQKLHTLNLRANNLNRDDVRTLLTGFPTLKDLNLQFTLLDLASLRDLLSANWLPQLHTLDLSENQLGNGAIALTRCEHFTQLQTLNLRGNQIGDDAAIALAHNPHLHTLTHLDLGICWLTDVGVQAIANSPYIKSLESLNLTLNEITEESIHAIATSQSLSQLRTLHLFGCEISTEAQKQLKQSTTLSPQLYVIH